MSLYLNIIQKYSWILILVPLALLGGSLGNLAATLIGSAIAPSEQLIEKASPGAATARNIERIQSYQSIQDRNIFNSESTRSTRPMTQTEPRLSTAASTAASGSSSSEKLKLRGTVSGGGIPLALIQVAQESQTYRLGDTTPGGATIIEIGRKWVILHYDDGRKLRLQLPEEGDSAPGVPTQTRQPPSSKKAQGNNLYAWPQIVSTGENSWRIAKDEANKARSNLSELLKQARLVPRTIDGKTNGFTVAMIRPGSFLAALGIKRGDTIIGVNGLELDGPEKALQVFQQLREARELNLSLVRAGQNMTFEYEID